MNYLPNLNEDIVKGITLRHLLTHSHGLRTTTDGHLFNFFPAGEGWDYRKENISMLCEIVQRATGKTVAQIAREEIFTPLGFQKAGWYANPIDDMVLTVFDRDNAPSYELRDSVDGDLPNMFSTTRDLAYWGFYI